MQFRLIRNATLVLDYAGHRLLIDPDFGQKGSRRSFTGLSPNPMVEMPLTPEQILAGVESVVVSHLHADHFDTEAQAFISKTLPLLCPPVFEAKIREMGFQDVTPVQDVMEWNGIRITRTGGHHGLGEVETLMGVVSGFVFQAEGEPTLYWTGDTVLCDEVRDAITQFAPQVIVTHSSGARWAVASGDRDLIVMDAAQTIAVCHLAPESTVVATHMEALDHSTVSRSELREFAGKSGISVDRLRIPADGDLVILPG